MTPAPESLRRWSRRADLLLSWGEVGVYFLAALILMVGGGVLAVEAITTFVRQISDGEPLLSAATEVLSVLLLVFVFVREEKPAEESEPAL